MKANKYFSAEIDEHLIYWISIDTWYSRHLCDMERFYRFVHSLRSSKKDYSDDDIKENIKRGAKNYHNDFDKERLEGIAKEFVEIARHCLDFSKIE